MKTILVIENNYTLRVTLLEILTAEGFRTIAATNEMMGVQQAKLKLPDLILSEAQIPGFDGYAVLDALRQDDQTKQIPFIFLSIRSSSSDIEQGMSRGADAYLAKPVTLSHLLHSIAICLHEQPASTIAETVIHPPKAGLYRQFQRSSGSRHAVLHVAKSIVLIRKRAP